MIVLSIVVVLAASLAIAGISALLLLKALLHAIRPGNPSAARAHLQQ